MAKKIKMGRNLDRGLGSIVNSQQSKYSGSKSPKTDKVKSNTSEKLNKNLNK